MSTAIATPNGKVMLTENMGVKEALGLVAAGKVPMDASIEWDNAR